MTQDNSRRPDDWLIQVARGTRFVRIGLIVFAVAFAALAGYLGYSNAAKHWPFIAYGVAMGMVGLGTILYLLLREPTGSGSDATVGRTVVLVSGGLVGFFTFMLGLALLYVWWDSVFSGGLEKWRANVPSVLGTLAAVFGGLIIMFASLQVARSEVRTDPTLRVLLYGYNAALTWILLFCVLGFLNLLAYMPVQRAPVLGSLKSFLDTPIDWTKHGQYSLKPETIRSLRTLNKPVKIYAIISNGNEYRRDVDILLNNFRGLTDRLTVEYLSPDLDADRVKELAKEYKITSREGFLILVGTKPNEENAYIDLDGIINTQGGMGGDRKREIFQGEYHLIRQINFIVRENKVKPTLYFTQGHGEPGVNDFQAKAPVKLSSLKTILDDNNFEVKELPLGPNAGKVPDDAAVVVIVRPTLRFDDSAVKALRDYMNRTPTDKMKKGKLAVLLDVVTTPDGKMAETGLDGLMAEYGVQVGNDRILSTRSRNATSIQLDTDPNNRTELGRAFSEAGLRMVLNDVRTITPNPGAGPGAKASAAALFVNILPDSWPETNLQASPRALAEDLRKPDRAEELKAKVKKDLPVAVTVVDAPAGAPGAKEEESPRLVVVGDAEWIDSTNIQQSGGGFASIFLNMMLWLHGRPDLGELPSRQDPDKYELTAIKNEEDYFRVRTLSGGLLVVSILALGAGIWVVRRR
jgi:hypothetical protein